MRTEKRMNRIRNVLNRRQPDLTIVMENILDPHNVSAILRSADAVGIMEVQLVYTSMRFPEIGKKSSASAKKWIDIRKFNSIDECYSKLHEEKYKIYATHLEKKSKYLYETDLTKRIAIVLGNEHKGVSDEAADLADGIIQIPMFGMIQSLNVSVAAAVILFEAMRQRLKVKHYAEPKLSKNKILELSKLWAMKK